MGGLRPVQPSFILAGERSWGSPPRWAPVPLRPPSSSPSLEPCGCQNSDSNTGSDTTPNTPGALRVRNWTHVRHAPEDKHTHTDYHGVGGGGSHSLTQGEGLVGGLARAHFHLLLTTRL